MNELIKQIEAEQLKSDIPQFNVGDTIRVYAKVVEGSKERIQMFEGIVIKKQNGGARETFTVRRIASGGLRIESNKHSQSHSGQNTRL